MEQIETFRSAKIVRLGIKQSYGEAEGVNFPFEKFIRKIFEGYAQCEFVGLNSPEYDLTIKINATGQAMNRVYEGITKIGATYQGVAMKLYTGASLSGSIKLEFENLPPYTKTFSGARTPPPVIYENSSDADRRKPSKAPFMNLYPFFLSALLETGGRDIWC